MAYIDIYNRFAGLTGATATEQASFVKSIINMAAEDLYSQSDLVNCLREQVFVRDAQQQTNPVLQYTLPWYVWKVRGMREYNTGINIINHDMRPRYQTQGWNEFIDPFTYRVKQNILTVRDTLNEGKLTIRLPDGEMVATVFDIWIGGSNGSKSRFVEKVSFAVGDTEKETTNLFSTIDGVKKSTSTEFDLYILDADGETVSFIPNCETGPNYTLIQVSDFPYWNPEYVEVLYKTKFIPFTNDQDEFPCGNLYDMAIVYKAAEQYYITQRKDFKTATGFYIKCNEIVNNIAVDFNDNNEKKIDFGSNQYLGMLPSAISRTPLNPFFRLNRTLC